MRGALIASLALTLTGSLPALAAAQEAKPPAPEDIAPAPPSDAHPIAPPGDGPKPGEPTPPPPPTTSTPAPRFGEPGGPLHRGDKDLPRDANKPAKPAEKPKLS